jgi:hypothetical protein
MERHRDFRLPQDDEGYLDSVLQLPWETRTDNSTQWLVIRDWTVCSGYDVGKVSLALRIPPNYADTQIDMVYFSPALSRLDGRPISAIATEHICGETYQRWSRHRTPQNPWRPSEDNIASHLALVADWLTRELEK